MGHELQEIIHILEEYSNMNSKIIILTSGNDSENSEM